MSAWNKHTPERSAEARPKPIRVAISGAAGRVAYSPGFRRRRRRPVPGRISPDCTLSLLDLPDAMQCSKRCGWS